MDIKEAVEKAKKVLNRFRGVLIEQKEWRNDHLLTKVYLEI